MEETSKKVRQREIKFRAWVTESERMVYDPYHFELYHYSDENRVNQQTYRIYETWRDLEDGTALNCELMQYTGLKDKNGKEIYEGDIFRIEENNGLECDFCDGTGTVEGGKYIETTCEKCDGTGIVDEGDRVFHVVITWVHEWAMFCSLLAHSEYESYLREGIKALDEPMFWTYTLEDTDSRKHFLCGNIFEHPHLLSQGEIKTELI